jgi:hypothetical protein
MADIEKKLDKLFSAHGKQVEDKTRALQVQKKEREQRAIVLTKYAKTVLEPTLQKLAKIAERNGQKAVVHPTTPISADGLSSRASIRVIPAGTESKSPEKYHPLLEFELTAQHDVINVFERAVFGGGGNAETIGAFPPDELGAERIEALFVSLIERTFRA